jgi:5-methyltetrahydropteroyltriglutamate--homocysteine methyltransferase
MNYRADVVGSLLRPPSLKRARDAYAAGTLPAAEFKRVEDRAVDMAIARQEAAGLPVVTDGEMRRAFYFDAIWNNYEGIIPIDDSDRVFVFRSAVDEEEFTVPGAIVERLRRRRTAAVEEYAYARARAHVPVKVTMQSPLGFGVLWNAARSTSAYKDVYEMFAHAVELLRDEVQDLAAHGCTYIQVDLPELTMMLDKEAQARHWDTLGLSPEWLKNDGIALVDAVAAETPGVCFGLHFCRGNHQSKWLSTGGYAAMSEVFGRVPHFDRLLLEYDTDRAGSFEPLRDVPDDKVVVLGLVSTKVDTLEDPEVVLSRIDEAAQYFPREHLALSTQCGFASSVPGNNLTEEDQEAKLLLVTEVAERAWGTLPVAV